jgi:hypothetical protein
MNIHLHASLEALCRRVTIGYTLLLVDEHGLLHPISRRTYGDVIFRGVLPRMRKSSSIQPRKPAQEASTGRAERMSWNANNLDDIEQLRLMAELWAYDYNHNHPHTALGGMAPIR